jgi:hypothetical protein
VDNNNLDLDMSNSGFVHTLPNGRRNMLMVSCSVPPIRFFSNMEERNI